MAVETKYAASVAVAGSCVNPGNATGAPDGVFTGNTDGTSWTTAWNIAAPNDPLTSGATHTVTVTLRRSASGGGDPTAAIELWQSGSLVATLSSSATVANATSHTRTATFTTGQVTSGSTVQIAVNVVGAGGSPSNRRNVQVDAVEVAFNTDPPSAPIVDAGADVTGHWADSQFTRTATNSGGAPTSQAWTIEAGPAGVGSTIGTAAALAWTPTTVGTYTLRYTATNGLGSDFDELTVEVVTAPPMAKVRGASVDLDAAGNDNVLTKPAGTVEGDLMIIVHVGDQDAPLSDLQAPVGGGTWTALTAETASTGHMKLWWRVAGPSEPASYSVDQGSSSDAAGALIVFYDYDTADPFTTPVVGVSTTATTNHVAPSVDPGVQDGLLVTFHAATGAANTVRSYTPPSGMTEQADTGNVLAAGQFVSVGVFTEYLTSTAATGTRTAVSSDSTPYHSASLVINPPPPSGPPTGAALGSWGFTGTAAGQSTRSGAGSSLLAWAGAAVGAAPTVSAQEGSAVGGLAWSGTAAGAAPDWYPSASWTGSTPWGPHPPGGAASDTWAFTGTAAGRTRQGAAAGLVTWAGAAVGSSPRSGAGTGLTGWAGTTAGSRPTEGSGTGTATWAGAAAGQSTRTGTGSGLLAWTSHSVGHTPTLDAQEGAASGAWTVTGTATGARAPQASGAGSWAVTGSATGRKQPQATGAGATAYLGAATGQRAPQGAGSGILGWAGAGQGTTARTGAASGSWSITGTAASSSQPFGAAEGMTAWVGAAAGRHVASGTASGEVATTGSATGSTPAGGAATSDTTWAGAATGQSTRSGSGSGLLAWTSHAVGTAPVVGQSSGSGSGAWSTTGTAVGRRASGGYVQGWWWHDTTAIGESHRSGTASGTREVTGTAAGERSSTGSASGAAAFTGTAAGSTTRQGTTAGTWATTGVATGTAPFLPPGAGTASGAVTVTGAAAGYTLRVGQAAGVVAVVASAAGYTLRVGLTAGDTAWAGTGRGLNQVLFPLTDPVTAEWVSDGTSAAVFTGDGLSSGTFADTAITAVWVDAPEWSATWTTDGRGTASWASEDGGVGGAWVVDGTGTAAWMTSPEWPGSWVADGVGQAEFLA